MINEIVFGMTAAEWRRQNADKPTDRNWRDYAPIVDLVMMNNLEVIDSMLLQWDCSIEDRRELLQQTYDFQYSILKKAKSIQKMQHLHDEKMKNLDRTKN
jgi:hypothetical protein